MKRLLLDTSGPCIGLGFSEDASMALELHLDTAGRRAEMLAELVVHGLNILDWQPQFLDELVIGAGPGSYTGLRIGYAVVKAMAFALNKPLIELSSLKAMAWDQQSSLPICPIIDARTAEIYTALYRWDEAKDQLLTVMDDQVASLEALCSRILEPTLIIGDGAGSLRTAVASLVGKNAIFAPFSRQGISAQALLRLASQQDRQPGRPLWSAEPMYLRPAEAERKRQAMQTTQP